MIKPCGHRLVVKPYKYAEVDEVTKKHLEFYKQLTIAGKETRDDASVDKGHVLSIGPTAWKDFDSEPWCKVGDEIIFAKFAGKIVTDPETNEDVFILNDADVVAVVKEA
jgi:co-chaperonin GroES (HSP10)